MFRGIFAEAKIPRLKIGKAQHRLPDVNKAHWWLARSSNATTVITGG